MKGTIYLMMCISFAVSAYIAYAACGETCIHIYDTNCTINGQCCGGFYGGNNFLFTDYCCLGSYYPASYDKDDNPCKCSSTVSDSSLSAPVICSADGQSMCWDPIYGGCCGDDINENFVFYSKDPENILLTDSCVNGSWLKRTANDLIIYNLVLI